MEVKSSGKERRRLSSSTPPKRPLTQKPSTSDENDQYYQQVGNSNLQSPKKPLTKNYMSPTTSISAASKPKAIASRKNILRERNKASEPDFSNTHVEKSHIAIDNVSHSLSQALPKSPPSFQSHDADEALSDDLASRPYDPVTNYLSPRPQFLRYKPNRRQELFLGLENGVGFSTSTSGSFDYQKATGEEVGAVTSPSSLALPRPDGTLKQEDEGIELSDEDIEAGDAEVEGSDEESDEEEYEEVEEEKIGKLKGVLKSLLLLLAIVLFASYMSPMNHQTHFEVMEDAYCSIQNSTIEAALLKKLESRGNLWDQKEERHTGFVEVIKGAIEMGTEEVIIQGEEMQIDEDIEDEAKVEDENLGDVELADEMREVVKPQAEEIEEEKEGGIHGLGEVVVMPQLEDIEDISGDIVENSELQGVGPSVSDDFDHQNLVSDVSNAFEKGEVAAEQNDGIVEKITEGAEESSTNMAAEPVIPETMDNDDISFDEASDLKAEGNWREKLINFMKSKTFYTTVIGVSVFSVIVASLASVFHFKQRNTTKKDSSLIVRPSAKPLVIEQKKINGNVSPPPSKPYSETVIAERYNSELPSTGDDSIEHVYSSFRRMSLSSKHSTGAVHSQAPTVELLDELVFGEVSSSLRSMTEGEESNYSVSSKKLGSKAQSVSIQAQPAVSEFSSMDLHSYGSFSTPRKVMKKKAGNQDGEVTTPLRRSSRLRNKMVTSP